MKISEKLISESTRDTVTAYIGFFLMIAGIILLIFFFEYLFIAWILLVYLLMPPVYAVNDMIKGRIRRSFVNLVSAVLYNYLATLYDIISIILLVPVIALDLLMGPLSVILFIASVLLLLFALIQWITGSRLGASDMKDPEMLFITGSTAIITGLILYINFFVYHGGITGKLADTVLGALRKFITMLNDSIER